MNRADVKAGGFTLIELMIVLAVIAIVAAIAIPSLMSARLNANESAAIATLKSIASAQSQCQTSLVIDTNRNGNGEYGGFGELSGAVALRGSTGAAVMTPPVLSAAFGRVANSMVVRSGYCFQIWLPDSAGHGVAEDPTGGYGTGSTVAGTQAESTWCCYAWPSALGTSGKRVFFVNQTCDIRGAANVVRGYNGTLVQPTYDAAFAVTGSPTMAGVIAANTLGLDGETWVLVN